MRTFTLTFLCLTIVLLSALPASSGTYSKTWTKYPIILVPGVFSYEEPLGMDVDYFYGIEKELERTSYTPDIFNKQPFHQQTHFISLSPWQNTTDRAKDLKDQLTALMNDKGYEKVNIIAHSHGATTARQAIHMMVKEAKTAGKKTPVASLTCIAGPHKGTPVADYFAEHEGEPLTEMAVVGMDLAGNFMSLLSGTWQYIGNQSSRDAALSFSKENIAKFNNDFPSAGVPDSTLPYGADAAQNGSFAGNGLGQPMDVADPEAILYYSWTGNIGSEWNTACDPFDVVMLVTDYLNDTMEYGGDADGFIPVTSSRFGRVINENFYWNHIDEINNGLGIVNPDAADPKTIFRLHAQRLQNAGR